MCLNVGDTFESFDDFEEELQKFCQSRFVTFRRSDCRYLTDEVAETVAEALRYKYVRYSCEHSRIKASKAKELGISHAGSKRRQYNESCNAEIYIALDRKTERLVVLRNNEEHSHAIDPAAFKPYVAKGHSRHLARSARRTRREVRKRSYPEYEWNFGKHFSGDSENTTAVKHASARDQPEQMVVVAVQDYSPGDSAEESAQNPGSKFAGRDQMPRQANSRKMSRRVNDSSLSEGTMFSPQNTATQCDDSSLSEVNLFPPQNTITQDDQNVNLARALIELTEAASKQTRDPDDMFFNSISSEIKSLPRHVRSDLKLRVLSLVNEAIQTHCAE